MPPRFQDTPEAATAREHMQCTQAVNGSLKACGSQGLAAGIQVATVGDLNSRLVASAQTAQSTGVHNR